MGEEVSDHCCLLLAICCLLFIVWCLVFACLVFGVYCLLFAIAGAIAVTIRRNSFSCQGQIERHFHTAEARARQIAKTVHGKGQAIARLEDENHQQVRSAAGKAYRAIEDVVTTLLTIEDGNQRLSRANASIMQGLQDSVKNFESLCAISRENKDELGVKAGDCKELGDGAGRLVRALAGKAAGLNIDARAAWGFRGDHERTRQMHSGDEANLRSRCDEKRWAINVCR